MVSLDSLIVEITCKHLIKYVCRFFYVTLTKIKCDNRSSYYVLFGNLNSAFRVKMWGWL